MVSDCNICYLSANAKLIDKQPHYTIVKDGDYYYSIWHECVTWGGVRTCKRKIHDMRHETERLLKNLFKPDFVGMEVVEGPHLHFKCKRIKKGAK